MYAYVKTLHIIFIVTWFSGLFYIVRLFVYTAEAHTAAEPGRSILLSQLGLMSRRLWYGITWPSAVLTLIFGSAMLWLYGALPGWLLVKLAFVAGLYAYHFSLHHIFRQQQAGIFKYSSQQLRLWNEVATIFLFSIVTLVVVKESLSFLKALAGLLVLVLALVAGISVYKKLRGGGGKTVK